MKMLMLATAVSVFAAITGVALLPWFAPEHFREFSLEQLDQIPIGGQIGAATEILGEDPVSARFLGGGTSLLYTPRVALRPHSALVIVNHRGDRIKSVYIRELEWFFFLRDEPLYLRTAELREVSERFQRYLKPSAAATTTSWERLEK